MGWGCQQSFLLGSRAPSPHVNVGGCIAAHIADESPGNFTYVGIDRLVRLSHRWRSDVKASIALLEQLGEITVERRPGRTSLYRIEWKALEWPAPEKVGQKHDLELTSGGRNIADLVGIDLKAPGRVTGRPSDPVPGSVRPKRRRNRAVSPADTGRCHRPTPGRVTGHEPPVTPGDRGAPSAPAPDGSPDASASEPITLDTETVEQLQRLWQLPDSTATLDKLNALTGGEAQTALDLVRLRLENVPSAVEQSAGNPESRNQ